MEFIIENRMALAIMIPFIAGFLVLNLGKRVNQNIREGITISAAILTMICVVTMAPQVLSGIEYKLSGFEIVEGIDFSIKTDSGGMVFACVSSILWCVTSVYSIGYMRGHGEKNQTGFYAAFAACIGAAMGICFAANLFTFIIFYEILTIATYPLVVHYRNSEGKASGRKYLVYTIVSGQIFFVGIAIIFMNVGSVDFVPGGFVGVGDLSNKMAFVVYFMLIIGGMVKAGVIPVHSWLPAAMVAPTPVSALLHAVAVVKAGAFLVFRITHFVFEPELLIKSGATLTLAAIAGVTIILGSLIAMTKDNLKARLAYSTVSQLSYIILGVAILTPISVTGALFHIVAHAFLKITLFMCAGAIFVVAHKSNVRQLYGLGKKMPITMCCFTLASLGIAGLPFMAGFVSKFNIMSGALMYGKPVYAFVLVASALLSLTYLVPIGYIAFHKVNGDESASAPASDSQHAGSDSGSAPGGRFKLEGPPALIIPIIITLSVAIILGINPNFGPHLLDLASNAAKAIFEGGLPV